MRPGTSSDEDPDRLLPRFRSAWEIRTHSVRLPGLHLPTATGKESLWEVLCEFPAGDQRQSSQSDLGHHSRMAVGLHQEQSKPGGSGPAYQSSGAGLDELLRTVLSIEVCSSSAPRQSGARSVGAAEI